MYSPVLNSATWGGGHTWGRGTLGAGGRDALEWEDALGAGTWGRTHLDTWGRGCGGFGWGLGGLGGGWWGWGGLAGG